jgi:exodeoxyribonuclease V alpha subunit
MPELPEEGEAADFVFLPREEPEQVLEEILALVTRRIPARHGFDPVDGIQVLTPMHRGILGATHLNEVLGGLLNPRREAVTRGTRMLRLGDKVMQIRNNYQLDVFNGDIGRICEIREIDRQVRVRFEDRIVAYDFADLDELVPAYACSIHKAQGSEYPCVVIPVHTQHYVMLQRNLLYTGITRGRKLVVLVGSRRALGIAVRNNRIEARYTRLADRLADRGPD